jgi:hypothetical protein
MRALGVLLGCAENAQRLRYPVQTDTEHLDRQDHCHILPEDNAMGDVFNNEEDCAPSNAAANWRREKAGPDISRCCVNEGLNANREQ